MILRYYFGCRPLWYTHNTMREIYNECIFSIKLIFSLSTWQFSQSIIFFPLSTWQFSQSNLISSLKYLANFSIKSTFNWQICRIVNKIQSLSTWQFCQMCLALRDTARWQGLDVIQVWTTLYRILLWNVSSTKTIL